MRVHMQGGAWFRVHRKVDKPYYLLSWGHLFGYSERGA
jgi:hypothetical protein